MEQISTYVEHAARGRNDWWRYVAGVLLGLLLAILLALAASTVLAFTPFKPAAIAAGLLDTGRPVAFFLLNGALFGVVLAGFWLAIAIVNQKRFTDIVGVFTWPQFGAGLAIWAGALIVATLIDFALAPSGFSITAGPATPALALAALVGLAVQTFTEEFVFRGYFTQGLLLALKRPLPAALASGVLFGAMHIPNGTPQAVSATVFGVVLALIAMRTGGIAFTYGLHLANNLFGAAVVVSSGDAFQGSPGLFTQSTPQLMWWDAGVGAAALLLLAWGVARFRRASHSPPGG